MLPEDSPRLTILFDVRDPEQLEAVHYWRAAFAEAADIEPVLEDQIWALHISPSIVRNSREAV